MKRSLLTMAIFMILVSNVMMGDGFNKVNDMPGNCQRSSYSLATAESKRDYSTSYHLIDVVLSFKPVDEPEKRDKGYFSAKLWKIYVAKNVPATYMRLGI